MYLKCPYQSPRPELFSYTVPVVLQYRRCTKRSGTKFENEAHFYVKRNVSEGKLVLAFLFVTKNLGSKYTLQYASDALVIHRPQWCVVEAWPSWHSGSNHRQIMRSRLLQPA